MSVDIAKLVLQSLQSVADTVKLKSATLLRSTIGTRGATVSAGTNPTTTNYVCQALIEVLTVSDVPQTLIEVNDRKIGILGASLPAGIIPVSTDRVTIADLDGVSKTFRLIGAISGDGVGAMYEFQARL